MTLTAVALYAAVYFAAVATPGPGVAALVARVLGRGLAGVVPFILGFVVGDLVWLAVAAAGLTVVAHAFAAAFFVSEAARRGLSALCRLGPRARGRVARRIGGGGRRAKRVAGFSRRAVAHARQPEGDRVFLVDHAAGGRSRPAEPRRFRRSGGGHRGGVSATLGADALAAQRARGWMRSSRSIRLARRTAAGVMAGVAVAVVAR